MGRGNSIERVERAAREAGLDIDIRRFGAPTRSAAEAAERCGCDVAEIVKTLLYQGERSGDLYAFMLTGDRQLDVEKAAAAAREPLRRADAKTIRAVTGFAIGGVAPIGHLSAVTTFADRALAQRRRVWAAAGAQDAVFAVAPPDLLRAAGAVLVTLS